MNEIDGVKEPVRHFQTRTDVASDRGGHPHARSDEKHGDAP